MVLIKSLKYNINISIFNLIRCLKIDTFVFYSTHLVNLLVAYSTYVVLIKKNVKAYKYIFLTKDDILLIKIENAVAEVKIKSL